MKRREFVVHISRAVVALSAVQWSLPVYSSSVMPLDERNMEVVLAELSYLLLPLLEPDSEVYRSVAHVLQQQMASSPAADKLLNEGVAALDHQANGRWLSLTRIQRKEMLESFVDEPFIGMVRWTTHEQVLRDRQVWEALGYQGSAIEKGGYLTRGFDDINWLPGAAE